MPTTGERDLRALDDFSVAGTVNAVTVTAVARAEASTSCAPNCYGVLRLRLGGGSWTDADVDSLQAGIELAAGGTASTVRVTQVFATVNVGDSIAYTYTSGTTGMNTLSSLMKNGATMSFAYDANGNLDTKTGGWEYDWNVESLLTLAKLNGAQQQAYVYDGLGRRVKVDGTSSTWTVSIVSGIDTIFEKDNAGAVTKYVTANGMRIAKITPSGAVQYYLGDHLGSTRKVLDSGRTTIFSTDYEPFGKPYAPSGTEAYKYTGEKHDDPTGLVYLRARQYDPDLGRFVSADPVLGSLSVPQTQNRFTYAIDNPLRYTDPSGEFINLIAAGIGALVGGIVGYGACLWATGGWTSSDCAVAAGAGAAVGGLAGLTFGASLALAGAAGLGTTGLSGLAAFTFAGAVSGAVAGGADYLLSGGIAMAQGKEWQFSSHDFVESVGWGVVLGAATGAAGYGIGKGLERVIPRVRVWWNENVRGLRNGASIGSDDIEWAVGRWMGRGRLTTDWADDGGFQVSRTWGRFRVQARYESWGRGGLDSPHLNLELWQQGPAGRMVRFTNNHIYFYDIGG